MPSAGMKQSARRKRRIRRKRRKRRERRERLTDQVASYDCMEWVPTVTERQLVLNRMEQSSVIDTPLEALCPYVDDLPAMRRVTTLPCGCKTTQLFELHALFPLVQSRNTLLPKWLDHEVVGDGCTITQQRFYARDEMYHMLNVLKGRFNHISRSCDQSPYVMAFCHLTPEHNELVGYPDKLITPLQH